MLIAVDWHGNILAVNLWNDKEALIDLLREKDLIFCDYTIVKVQAEILDD